MPEDLLGGDAAHNARRLRAVLAAEERGPHRDALVLGTAIVLQLVGAVEDLREAASAAAKAIDDGRARRVVDLLTAFGSGDSGDPCDRHDREDSP